MNFGDLLGPIIAEKLLEDRGLFNCAATCKKEKLISVGSVLHFANDGDVIWGAGRNGKVKDELHSFKKLDVRAVRGPLTREFLMRMGIEVPEVYGDPVLLLPKLFPSLCAPVKKKYEHIFIPNYNDKKSFRSDVKTLLPTQKLWEVIESIRLSSFVSSSSLHGIVVAEALGVPCRIVRSVHEDGFKYEDYFLGTGRDRVVYASTPEEAFDLGGQDRPNFSPEGLLNAFPFDVFCEISGYEK